MSIALTESVVNIVQQCCDGIVLPPPSYSTLCTGRQSDTGEQRLGPGMCAGFRAGTGAAHQLVNREAHDAVFLAIGDRSQGDSARYPVGDLRAELAPDGQWDFTRKDGTPY